MFSKFEQNVATAIPANKIVLVNGLPHVSWQEALKGAAMPEHRVVTFGNKPGMIVFGDLITAVDMVDEVGNVQRIFRAVLDEGFGAVAAKNKDSIGSMLQSGIARNRVRAVEAVWGWGACIRAGFGGDAEGFYKALGVTGGDSAKPLYEVEALTDNKGEKGPAIIRWNVALCAAKIADPSFHWEVVFYPDENGNSNPYMKVGDGFFVTVQTVFKGKVHQETLCIMDMWTYEPMTNPDGTDWSRACMRCLTKAIKAQTGYGICEADSDEPEMEAGRPPSAEEVEEVLVALKSKKKSILDMMRWLGVDGEDMTVLNRSQIDRAKKALGIVEKEEPPKVEAVKEVAAEMLATV